MTRCNFSSRQAFIEFIWVYFCQDFIYILMLADVFLPAALFCYYIALTVCFVTTGKQNSSQNLLFWFCFHPANNPKGTCGEREITLRVKENKVIGGALSLSCQSGLSALHVSHFPTTLLGALPHRWRAPRTNSNVIICPRALRAQPMTHIFICRAMGGDGICMKCASLQRSNSPFAGARSERSAGTTTSWRRCIAP